MVTNQPKTIERKSNNKNIYSHQSKETGTPSPGLPQGITEGEFTIDEGWWESIMTEDETYAKFVYSSPGKQADPGNHSNAASMLDPMDIDWEQACELYEKDQVIQMQVVGYNRGGLLVEGEGMQGFVPVSHLVETPCSSKETLEWFESYLQRPLLLKIIECDPDRGRIVFSERAALSEPGSRIHLLNRLQPGDCITGMVTNITDFGVFVDLGGVEGLIHVSELSWGRVRHPSDMIKLDQKVSVYVIQVDRERARVGLSIKRLYPNPWETAEQRYYPGQIVQAVVTSIVPFGAFARVEEGLDGLIHISEMASDSPGRVTLQSIEEGSIIKARVLHVDCNRQRLGLSLNLE
jgi:small subunit ribosomal protein S1